MTAVAQLIGIGLKTALSGNANIVALVGTNIYDAQPQAGLLTDFVVFHYMNGGDENIIATRSVDCEYMVIGESAVHDNAELLAGYIDDTLHNQTLTITGWNVWGLQARQLYSSTEDINGAPWFRRGSIYRLRVQSNT